MIILGITRKAGKDRTGRLSEEGRGNEGSCKSCLPCFIYCCSPGLRSEIIGKQG